MKKQIPYKTCISRCNIAYDFELYTTEELEKCLKQCSQKEKKEKDKENPKVILDDLSIKYLYGEIHHHLMVGYSDFISFTHIPNIKEEIGYIYFHLSFNNFNRFLEIIKRKENKNLFKNLKISINVYGKPETYYCIEIDYTKHIKFNLWEKILINVFKVLPKLTIDFYNPLFYKEDTYTQNKEEIIIYKEF